MNLLVLATTGMLGVVHDAKDNHDHDAYHDGTLKP